MNNSIMNRKKFPSLQQNCTEAPLPYMTSPDAVIYINYRRVAQNKIPHQTISNISATSGLILKILEAA